MSSHIERVRDALEAAGIEVNEVQPLPTGLGRQLRCAGGAVVVVYNTGKVVAQGKGAEAAKAVVADLSEAPARKPAAARPRTVSLPLVSGAPSPSASTLPGRFWTDEPWDGATLPWDPISKAAISNS